MFVYLGLGLEIINNINLVAGFTFLWKTFFFFSLRFYSNILISKIQCPILPNFKCYLCEIVQQGSFRFSCVCFFCG